MDCLGVPSWDRVGALAEVLIKLEGLCVTNTQADEIICLYDKLLDYDKRPLQFHQNPSKKPSRGHFGRSKSYRVGHVNVDQVRRYVLLKLYMWQSRVLVGMHFIPFLLA